MERMDSRGRTHNAIYISRPPTLQSSIKLLSDTPCNKLDPWRQIAILKAGKIDGLSYPPTLYSSPQLLLITIIISPPLSMLIGKGQKVFKFGQRICQMSSNAENEHDWRQHIDGNVETTDVNQC